MKKLLFVIVLILCSGLGYGQQPGALLSSEAYISHFGNLKNTVYRIKSEKKLTIAFLGGSITNMAGWRDKVSRFLSDTYPNVGFEFINAGIPSLGSLPHAFRLRHDVLSKGRIDLLFVESAVNDRVNGTDSLTQQRALEGIVRHALHVNPYTNVVLMAFVDEDKMADYHAGKTPVEVQVHEQLAQKYHLPFINLAKEVTDRIDGHEFNWKDDFKNLHPSPFGQEIYFKTIRQLLSAELNKPVPVRLMAAVLPQPDDPFNYENGDYLDIDKAKINDKFKLEGNWQPADSVGTRPGFVHVPMLVAEKPGASLELPFNGRAIGIGVVAGPDAGIINYTIDGKNYPVLNLYTKWSKSLHLPWYLMLGDGLTPGKHVLKLQLSDQHAPRAKGTACRIEYFLVNNP
jgi:hypothetical protein